MPLVRPCVVVSPVEASDPARTDERLRVVDAALPQISVLDLAVTRGDGVFEVLGVVDGHPQAVAAHLRRLGVSAAMLDLPPLDLDAVREAVLRVVALSEPVHEAAVKIVVSRGIEGSDVATCYVMGIEGGAAGTERTEGVDVVLLERGLPHDIAARAPWLLAGAKTLSYAVNKATLREAARRGAGDVVLTSSDGYVLEGPTSSLIVRIGGRIWTPAIAQGLLPGTTQASVFEFFAARGLAPTEALLRVEDLDRTDAAWLASSVRLMAPIRSIDGRHLDIDHDLTDAANAFLLSRTD